MTTASGIVPSDEDLEAKLQEAYTAYRKANLIITQVSLITLARKARKAAPEAVFIRMEWSDQGDFLSILGVGTETGDDDQELNNRQEVEDWRDDNTHLAWNLSGDIKATWERYAPENDGSTFDFLIDKLLAIEIDVT